jgi:hypothetical protein
MGAPSEKRPESMKGNSNGTKLKEPDVRQEAYRQYCKHIAEGWPRDAFFFDHPTHSVCWQTMEKYLEDTTEFNPQLLKRAQAARYQHWMKKGINLMEGQYKNGSPVVWQTIMRNIFRKQGWDNFKTHEEEVNRPNEQHFSKLMGQVNEAQSQRKIVKTSDSAEDKSE